MTADFGNFVAKNDEKRKMKWNGTVYTFLRAQLSIVIPLYIFAVYFVGEEMKAVK